MSERFRALEKTGRSARKDAVLLATVSAFESLPRPTRVEFEQFAELFTALYPQASEEGKRLVSAALSRAPAVPASVVRAICESPVSISAPFLSHSPALGESGLIELIEKHGAEHARAIARRTDLPERVEQALLALGDPAVDRALGIRRVVAAASASSAPDHAPAAGAARSGLRDRLVALARRDRAPARPAGREPPYLKPSVRTRLITFAENREPTYFATALADALGADFALAERIMLDISGRQLAIALAATGFDANSATLILERFFPHLALAADKNGHNARQQVSRARRLAGSLGRAECGPVLRRWLDGRTGPEDQPRRSAQHRPVHTPEARSGLREDRAGPAARRAGREPGPRLGSSGA